MIRKGFKMKIYPDKIAEYTKRHNQIWPELEILLKEQGVKNYSIFFDEETHILFGYVEVGSNGNWHAIADTDICKKWWAYMKDLMETNLDNSPVTVDLKNVFHMSS
ncbi:L-rhamnose mutarotase [Maribacter stanieri]|uniref:L-rhamnose mutarotase n=1 Tax=Maribacter stanieri TaxID=440514 RepID=A0A1I6IK02_9FLAO|nr:L-rhamnose mutarotase [Maribacter stanieri]SFR67052.1 L-rhamnose mutarotase [Maribacter stanieri]